MSRTSILSLLILLVLGLTFSACQPVPLPAAPPAPVAATEAAVASTEVATAVPEASTEAPTEAAITEAPPTAPAVDATAPAAQPTPLRVDAAPGSATEDGAVVLGDRVRYSVDMQNGEFLQVFVSATEQNAAITIYAPDGQPTPGTEPGKDATTWSGATVARSYVIEIGSTRGNASYSLNARWSPGPYQPVDAAACAAIKIMAETALKVPFTMSAAPFYDYANDQGGTGCLLTATGTGVDFTSPMDVVNALTSAMVGWTEDIKYQSGGPTGMGTGLTRDQALMLISAGWSPGPAATCPADQPISACALAPDQQIYTITINTAQK